MGRCLVSVGPALAQRLCRGPTPLEIGLRTISIGDVASTATLHDDFLLSENVTIHPGAVVLRGTSIGENVSVGANAVVENAVVLPDATIGPGAVVRDCIIGANATVGPNSTIEGGNAELTLDGEVHRDVEFGGLVGDYARLEGNVTVKPGTVIGEGVSVESGAVVSGRIADDAFVVRG